VFEIKPKDGGFINQFDEKQKRISAMHELLAASQIKPCQMVRLSPLIDIAIITCVRVGKADIDGLLPESKLNTIEIEKFRAKKEQVQKLEGSVKPELASELIELNQMINKAFADAKLGYYSAMANIYNTINNHICENKTNFFAHWCLKEDVGMATVVRMTPKSLTPENMYSIISNLKLHNKMIYQYQTHHYAKLDHGSVVLYIKLK